MSIKYIKGNLLDFPENCNFIAHCCSCQNRFGSGIALQIREEYPAAYEADTLAAKENRNTLGNISVATVSGGKKIINVYGQLNYGTDKRQVDYEAFYAAFESLKFKMEELCAQGRKIVLGVPYKIASDRAGGSWIIIEAMFKHLFENSPVELIIVEYKK